MPDAKALVANLPHSGRNRTRLGRGRFFGNVDWLFSLVPESRNFEVVAFIVGHWDWLRPLFFISGVAFVLWQEHRLRTQMIDQMKEHILDVIASRYVANDIADILRNDFSKWSLKINSVEKSSTRAISMYDNLWFSRRKEDEAAFSSLSKEVSSIKEELLSIIQYYECIGGFTKNYADRISQLEQKFS